MLYVHKMLNNLSICSKHMQSAKSSTLSLVADLWRDGRYYNQALGIDAASLHVQFITEMYNQKLLGDFGFMDTLADMELA